MPYFKCFEFRSITADISILGFCIADIYTASTGSNSAVVTASTASTVTRNTNYPQMLPVCPEYSMKFTGSICRPFR